ncbi:MAG: hypothetical protein AB7S74_17755 [Hyphomicrobium sp.]
MAALLPFWLAAKRRIVMIVIMRRSTYHAPLFRGFLSLCLLFMSFASATATVHLGPESADPAVNLTTSTATQGPEKLQPDARASNLQNVQVKKTCPRSGSRFALPSCVLAGLVFSAATSGHAIPLPRAVEVRLPKPGNDGSTAQRGKDPLERPPCRAA